jgi:hypothetical protein
MFSAIVLSAALLTQCENGVCRAPIRTVVAKTKTVVVDKQIVRQRVRKLREVKPVRRVVDRVVWWR